MGLLVLLVSCIGCTYNTTNQEIIAVEGADGGSDTEPSFTCETVLELPDGGETVLATTTLSGNGEDDGDGGMRDSANNPTEQVKGGWSQSGPLQQFFPNQRVKCQANLPYSQYYTVQFNVTPQDLPNVTDGSGPPPLIVPYVFAYRAVATIRWSVEGNFVSRMVDVGNGNAISGPGQGFAISVQDLSDAITAAALAGGVIVTSGSPDIVFADEQVFSAGQLLFFSSDSNVYTVEGETLGFVDDKHWTLTTPFLGPTGVAEAFLFLMYTVTIQVTEGTRPNPEVPPTLFAASVLLPTFGIGDSITVPVPPGSGANSVEVVAFSANPLTKPNVMVTQNNGGGAIIKEYDPDINIGFVSLMANASSVTVTNQDPANDVRITITFGIDG